MYINGKSIKELNSEYFLDMCSEELKINRKSNYSRSVFNFWWHENLYIFGPECFFEEVEKNIATNVPLNSKICFNESSTYPRFKLANTKLKVCRKIKSADYLVVGDYEDAKIDVYPSPMFVVETNDFMVVLSSYNFDLDAYDNETILNCIRKCNSSLKDAQYVYKGKLISVEGKYDFLVDYFNKKINTKLVKDSTIDKIVCSSLPIITQDEVNSLISMLNSKDSTAVALGMKNLYGFNIYETPLTIKTILCITEKWRSNFTVTSTGFKYLLKSLNMKNCPFYDFRLRFNPITQKIKTTEYDKKMATNIIYPIADYYNKTDPEKARRYFSPNTFNLKYINDVEIL